MRERAWAALLRGEPPAAEARRTLLWLVGVSTLARVVLTAAAHAPLIFSDELGYSKLAFAIGRTGRLALFDNPGLSYSPLYPVVLSPIYALGLSAPTTYELAKVENSLLMSLAVVPTYAIARSVLSRRSSLVVAALSAVAPLMFYTSFSMSENLAYPLALAAMWATLEAIRRPGVRTDAVLLVALVAATAARVQLVALFAAALTAIAIVVALGPGRAAVIRAHALLFGAVAAGLVVAGGAALAGHGVYSIFGRYAEAGRAASPDFGHFLNVLGRHVAETDLAVGVVPFAAALVATVAFARTGLRGRALPFAAVAVSTAAWLYAEVAYDGAVYDGHGDIARIHERFLIYVVPFFLVALLATVEIPEAIAPLGVYLGAAAVAALLPLAISYHDFVNQPSAVDTFGIQAVAHTKKGVVAPISHPAIAAFAGAAVLSFLFVHVRRQLRAVAILTLIPLVFISGQVVSRIGAGSLFTRSKLPAKANWVDAAKPHGRVVLVSGAGDGTPELETAYFNTSISSLAYFCHEIAGPEFGEQQVTAALRADYAVAPAALRVRGTMVARNKRGRQVLVRLPGGRLEVGRRPRCATSLGR